MANLYGVAQPNPPPLGGTTTGNVAINCPAGVETNIQSLAPPLPTLPGVFYPAMWGCVAIVFGATIPGLVTVGFRLNGGADLGSFIIHGGFYVATGSFCQTVDFYGQNTPINNPTGVWNFQLSIAPTAQAVTVQPNSTQLIAQWLRAPDQ